MPGLVTTKNARNLLTSMEHVPRGDRHDPSAPSVRGGGLFLGRGFSHMWLFLPLIHLLLTQLGQSSGKLGCFQGKRRSTSLCCMVVTGTKLVT